MSTLPDESLLIPDAQPRKKRGRPKKILTEEEARLAAIPKKRGRPKKTQTKKFAEKNAEKSTEISSNNSMRKMMKKSEKNSIAKQEDLIFSLDIGTRSVIGIVAEPRPDGSMRILATTRKEHTTRAMLDGQIHDVPQVAAVIAAVKAELEEMVGPLTQAAVAAAGRALYTMTAEAELDIDGIVSPEQQRGLEFAGVQAAQAKLALSHTIDDPTLYYCVGYSTIRYELDGTPLKTLVGQRGKKAKTFIISTFLPRQVIDSMQSALKTANLTMQALTLEPIAAINVLIPPTMRHLNLVLVDIGAGTSDVAITKDGSVIAYGMVPLAGDEITEAISQRFLLDFNVAEDIKRRAADGIGSTFTDILGAGYDLSADEIIEPILPNIHGLADAISKQILDLNGGAPQAVMLVGGGSLTPRLAKIVAEVLGMAENRVAVRRPEQVHDIEALPEELQTPDAVTPLGILKIASINTLHFLSIFVNDVEYNLFNFRDLTVSDALLNAGINLRKYNGKPGLGLMVTVNGEKKFFPGTLGTLAQITIDGEEANLDTPVKNGSHVEVVPGKNGTLPEITLAEVIENVPEYEIFINGRERRLRQRLLINQQPANEEELLKDGDIITSRLPQSLGEALRSAGYSPTGTKITYTLNGQEAHYSSTPEILLNDNPATISMSIVEGDRVDYIEPDPPKLGTVVQLSELDTSLVIYYNGDEKTIPAAGVELTVNGRKASTGTIIDDGAAIHFSRAPHVMTTVSDALLAVGFQPPVATSRVRFTILLNRENADFTSPVKNGDTLDVIIEPIDTPAPALGMNTTPNTGIATPPRGTLAAEREQHRKSSGINLSNFTGSLDGFRK